MIFEQLGYVDVLACVFTQSRQFVQYYFYLKLEGALKESLKYVCDVCEKNRLHSNQKFKECNLNP